MCSKPHGRGRTLTEFTSCWPMKKEMVQVITAEDAPEHCRTCQILHSQASHTVSAARALLARHARGAKKADTAKRADGSVPSHGHRVRRTD